MADAVEVAAAVAGVEAAGAAVEAAAFPGRREEGSLALRAVCRALLVAAASPGRQEEGFLGHRAAGCRAHREGFPARAAVFRNRRGSIARPA